MILLLYRAAANRCWQLWLDKEVRCGYCKNLEKWILKLAEDIFRTTGGHCPRIHCDQDTCACFPVRLPQRH